MNWIAVVCACFVADMKPRMHVLFVLHNRRLLVRLQCHNNVQCITSLGWEIYFAKYLTKLGKSSIVPITICCVH